MIALQRFTRHGDPDAFQRFLQLKYEVFVDEQAWPLPGDPVQRIAAEDPQDAKSCFILASDEFGAAGVVRGTMLNQAFPRRELLEHHLDRGRIHIRFDELATINSIAVRHALRGKLCDISGQSTPTTIAKALMCELAVWCREQGALALVFTAIRGVSAVFFEHLGAYVLDPLARMHGVEHELLNMALLLQDPDRFRQQGSPLLRLCPQRPLTPDEVDCQRYCRERHAQILNGAAMDQFVFAGLSAPR
ncbi:MAG: hypothetical protein U0939_13660 [Pirellulales bacterium]